MYNYNNVRIIERLLIISGIKLIMLPIHINLIN